jgi:hypothetical protein
MKPPISSWILALASVCIAATCFANESFPYTAQIQENGAKVRSGPGEQYYATERVSGAATVEVWRRAPGGWLGVRPLEESFSLVSADGLRYSADSDVAQVIGDKLVSWIGSNVESVDEHKWQVRLMPGESVVVQGNAELPLHAGARKRALIKIAPPSGEFRWIRESDLVEHEEERPDPAIELAQFRVLVEDEEDAAQRDSFVPRRVARRELEGQHVPSAKTASQPRAPKSLLSTEEFNQRLGELQLELSRLVVQPPEKWQLQQLSDDVAELIDRGSSTLHRARGGRFQEQIDEFADLQSRFVMLNQSDELPVGTGTVVDDDSTRSASADLDSAPLFDGTGWLLPVHSSKHNAPPFALLDEEGRILQFVSPAPGLNLHRFLRKEIGIFGQKSAHSRFEKPHLVADRVVDLARHRR